ncbi:MAG TPA: hypothetical protein VKD90_23185 [Gemmataceae bacterium]|nr:hypothetical protein [Gemmataceae bacterium]
MLSREEYERIIRTFLVELNHLCAEASEPELRAMPRFEKEIDSYLADLQEPITDAAYSLRTAFAFVDEYVGADWQTVITAGYDAYLLSQRARPKPE